MGILLETENARPPTWPHFYCTSADGRGWAWHEDPRRRACFHYESGVSAAAETVAAAIDGRDLSGIDRLLAVDRLKREAPGAVLRVFARPCLACKGNHYRRVEQILHAVPMVHPEAIPILRKTMVPERLLREPMVHDHELPTLPTDPAEVEKLLSDSRLAKKVKRLIRTSKNLPVWPGEPERTRVAQIAFARQYALRNRIGAPPILPLREPITP